MAEHEGLVIARNMHPNERSAYELAAEIYERTESELVTRDAKGLKDLILNEFNTARQAYEYFIREQKAWERKIQDRYQDELVVDLHNYAINDAHADNPGWGGEIDRDRWPHARWDHLLDIDTFDRIEISPLRNDYIVIEIPAVYEEEISEEVRDATEPRFPYIFSDDPEKVEEGKSRNQEPLPSNPYLYDADVKKSREAGLMSDEVVDTILGELSDVF